jgi:4-diphosphocytidyl-2-C-methyl-D-erythritol kinase
MNAAAHHAIERLAPAKINLALHVTGQRGDGYHEIDTLVVFARFGDRVTVSPADRDRFDLTGPYAKDVPADGENLVLKARDRLRDKHGTNAGPVAIRLEKNLPVASGVGGGSSDAAATLKALARLWTIDEAAELADIGLMLGADVPMCLAARPLVARGIGEAIRPVGAMARLALVLVNSMVAVATPAVFGALECRTNAPLPDLDAAQFGDAAGLARFMADTRNDLEAPAMRIAPEIAEALAELRSAGADVARMSGSGATCFGLFDTPRAAAAAASAVRARRPGWFAVATETGAS